MVIGKVMTCEDHPDSDHLHVTTVSVPRVPHITLWIHVMLHDSSSWGFPHSEIHGSKLICSSPWLIAAYHVLRRLLMPRHSPYALVRLNFLHRSFDLCCSLNCLSFFVHISVCNKKASLFHRFVFVLRFHARRNCFFTLLC